MKEIIELKEDENVVSMEEYKKNRLATAGEEPPKGVWIYELDEGAIFLVKDMSHPLKYLLHRFYLCSKLDNNAYLLYHGQDEEQEVWIIPQEFCKQFALYGIIQKRDDI